MKAITVRSLFQMSPRYHLIILLIVVSVAFGDGVLAETDADGDGMPDSWELLYSTPPTITGLEATADLDFDGANNLAEWTAMTDPTNRASVFKIQSFQFNPTNGAIIAWGSVSNRTYDIEWSSNLMVQFNSLATNLNSGPYVDTNRSAALCGFYRLKARWTGVFDLLTCMGCHNTIQGGNRAVVLDFTNITHHVLGPLTTNDCLACHDSTGHMGGIVVLHNADTPSTLYTLTGSPLTNNTEAAKLNPFCLACHDANGYGGLAPFSDGHMPPVINNGAWTNSAHSLKPITCFGDGQSFGCHSTTHGSKKLHLLAPYNVATTNVAQQEEGFCFTCHNGSISKAVTNDFIKTVHHPIVNTDTNRGLGRSVECTDCHNPHAAQSGASVYTNTATSSRNLVGNPNRGVMGWAVNYSGLTNYQAPDLANYTVVSNVVNQYEICFKCHSAKAWSFGAPPTGLSANGSDATPVETDVAQAFSPMNMSGHPVVTGLNNYSNSILVTVRGLLATNMLAPWKTNLGTQTMDCNDCHNTDALSPAAQGPHGSAVPFMLRVVFSGVATTATNWPDVSLSNYTNSWCSNCHVKGTKAPHSTGAHSGFKCYQCHIVIPHGGKISRLIADHDTMPARYAFNGVLDNANGIQSFKKRAWGTYRNSDCEAACGGGQHDPGGSADENW